MEETLHFLHENYTKLIKYEEENQ